MYAEKRARAGSTLQEESPREVNEKKNKEATGKRERAREGKREGG